MDINEDYQMTKAMTHYQCRPLVDEIARLRAEAEALDTELAARDWVIGQMELKDREQEAEIEALRVDAERLDWLESMSKSSRTGVSFIWHHEDKSYEAMSYHKRGTLCKTLRAAIDAARRIEGEL